jgi:hypothetical protein
MSSPTRKLRKANFKSLKALQQPRRANPYIRAVNAADLTYISRPALKDLAQAVHKVEKHELTGAIVEAGAALGGSAIVLASMKDPSRPMKVYDVFGMIPPPTSNDGDDVVHRYKEIAAGRASGIGSGLYYGYRNNLLSEVNANFETFGLPLERNNIELIEGRFEDTMQIDFPISLAHLDCDWFQSVQTCLLAIAPFLVPNGRIIVDDYNVWSGCRRAVDQFLSDNSNFFMYQLTRPHLVRLGDKQRA